MDERAPIVVGFDGSPTARGAVRFAADEAVRRRRPLRIVNVHDGWLRHFDEPNAEEMLREAMDLVRPIVETSRVELASAAGSAAEVLLAESAAAHLLVVGRGVPAMGSILGSVVPGAECPVIVVVDSDVPHMPHTGPVVVGVDDEQDATDALEEAFLEAALRSRDLAVVCAWHPDRPVGPAQTLPLGLLAPQRNPDVEERVRRRLAAMQRRHSEVGVTVLVERGRAADLLLAAGAAASMIVVGSRRRGRLAGATLGSVGRSVIRHSGCPVLIAHPRPLDRIHALGFEGAGLPESTPAMP